MKVLISERLSEHKYKTPEGYLICTDAILARTGKQRYTKDELFGNGDSEEVDVDRPYEQVMNEKTISSFENKPVTFDHPDEDVNVGNYKEYAVGYVRDVRQGKVDGQDVILGNLVITDQDAIDAIENGEHTDLSCGYDCDIKDDGHGSYYQNNIRGNHVALCREGRAGNARIIDSKARDSKIEGVPPELLLNLNDWFSDKLYIERKYHVKIYNIISNEGLTVTGSRQDLEKLYKDYRLENGYHLKIVDSKLNDVAIGGHYKNSRGENFFICSYGSGFSIFKADGEYLDGSRHLSLDGVKQRILSYNLTKVKDSAKDSIMKDESEDWTEMLIKLAVKNGKNSSGDYEYDGDADVNQVRRVLKKLGYKANGYVKNPKSYLHKLHYYFTDSEILEDMSSDPVVVKDDNLLGKRVRIRKRYSNLDGTIGTIYSYEGTNYDDEVEVKRNGHIYKVNYEDIEFLDSHIVDRPEGAFKQISNALSSYTPTKLVVLGHGWKWKVSTTPQGIVADFVGEDEKYGNDPAEMSRISTDSLKQDLQTYLQSKMQQHIVTVNSASFIKTSHGGIGGVRFRIGTKLKRDSLDDSIEDSNIVDELSSSEKDLCDYMLENCREEDEDENDLLKKMKLYYSAYSSLARNKPNEVLDYFREHIDNFEDSIKDSSNLSASKALKMAKIVSMLHKK